jgi:hypothetical protein
MSDNRGTEQNRQEEPLLSPDDDMAGLGYDDEDPLNTAELEDFDELEDDEDLDDEDLEDLDLDEDELDDEELDEDDDL